MRARLIIVVVLGGLLLPAAAPGAPRILSASFEDRPLVGVPGTLIVRVRDTGAAVNGLRVDFGDGGFVHESACRPLWAGIPPTGPFGKGAAVELRIPHVYTSQGRRTISVVAMAGDCTRGLEVARTQLRPHVRAADADPKPVRLARAAQAECGDVYAVGAGPMGRPLLCAINVVRRSRGLPALAPARRLRVAARRHARDMVRRGYFSHVTPEGTELMARLRRARARVGVAGENLAAGTGPYASPIGMLLTWLESPPHKANLLEQRFGRAGLGVAAGMPGEGAPDAATVVLVLAGR